MDETEQGNFFDQFDTPATTTTPAQPTAAQANFFDQFDEGAKTAAPGPTTLSQKVSDFAGDMNQQLNDFGVDKGKPMFQEGKADPAALQKIADAQQLGVTGDTAPDFGGDEQGHAEREAKASQNIGKAGAAVASAVGNTGLGIAAGLGKGASKFGRTAALIGGVLPAGYDAIVGGSDAYDSYAKNVIQPFDENVSSIEDFAKDRGRGGTVGMHGGELGLDLAMMGVGAGEANAITKGAETEKVVDIVGNALNKSADATKVVGTQHAADQVEAVQANGGTKTQSLEAGLTAFGTDVIANAIPAGIEGTLADRLGAGAVSGAATGEFQRQVNNVVLPESMHQDFDMAGAGWNILMQAGMGAVFHRAEMENPNKTAADYNDILRQADSGDATAKQTASIVSNLTSVDGLNGSAITAAKLGSIVHAETMNTPHDELMTGSSRYNEIFSSAIDNLGMEGAQAYAKAAYANETATDAAWDSYFAARNQQERADMSSKVTQQINDLHTQAKDIVPVAEMQKLRRWAFDNQRTPLEVRKALSDTIADRAAPEYIQDQYGEHFNDDGTLSQKAFEADSAMRPDTQHAIFDDTPETRQALVEGGVAPYVLDDGRLAVIGKPRDLNTLVEHVENRGGKLPSDFGGSHEVQESKGRAESNEPARPVEGPENGEPTAGRGDAENRQPDKGGRIDEGNPQAEDRVTTERIKKAGEVIDTRLAALDESAKGVRSKRELARLGRERDELEDLVRAQARARENNVKLAPENRLSDAELEQAHTRMDEIKLELEAHRRAIAHKDEGSRLRDKLSTAEDHDLVRIADNITNPRRAHMADELDGTPGVRVTSRGEAVVDSTADADAANKAMDVAGSDTGANTTDFAEPTAKQAAAGNYRKGGVLFKSPKGDLRVRIENPDGSVRKGKGWSRPIRGAHYGYIPGTRGADGDPLDVFLSRNAHDDSRPVAVISQHDPKTGKFDELKVVMGARTRAEAMELYSRQYPPGLAAKMLPDSKRNIVMMDRAKFGKFLASGNVDVPPHPVSGEPMLKYRAERERDQQQARLENERRAAAAEAQKAMNRETVAQETKPAQTVAAEAPAEATPKEPTSEPASESVSAAGTEGLPGQGGVRGGKGRLSTPTRAGISPLEGHPSTVKVNGEKVTFGPDPRAQDAARDYAREAGIPYVRPRSYKPVDEARATRIADEFERMEHAPNDPVVKAAYKAMVDETMAQWQAIKKTGLKVEFIRDGMPDPYARNPRLAIIDVNQNNHLWVFPTEQGFGGSDSAHVDISGNPLLAKTGEVIDGHELVANDVFRIVHDYFGHIKEGIGFRADGEENAWRSHAAMYSPLARRAMTTETRGQNSWVNYGPYGEHNKTANGADTQYAPQKIGLLPEWVSNEGAPRGLEGPRYMFAGTQARTADKSMLQQFTKNEAAGMDRNENLAATGWQRGRDGDWRFEIADNTAKLNWDRLEAPFNLDTGETFGTVRDVLDHSELLKAYPQLGDIKIRTARLGDRVLGQFTEGKEIVLNSDLSQYQRGETPLKVVIHELQHAVQQIEGWARGGNPHEFYDVMQQQASDLADKINTKVAQMESLEKANRWPEAQELLKDVQRLRKRYDSMGYGSETSMRNISHDKYELLAGEVEARNTASRIDMSAEDRMFSPRQDTQDRDDDFQSVKFGHAGMEANEVSHRDAIAAHVEGIAKKWKSSPLIDVVRNRDELPEFLRSQVDMQLGGEVHPEGIYHDGRVFLLSDNIVDTAHAERVVLHETMGHLGLRGTFGDKLDPLLDSIHASLVKDGRLDALREQYGKSYAGMDEQALNRAIAEEHLAQLAETNADPSAWARVAAAIRKALRSMGMVREWSDNDLRVLMAGVARDVREGRVSLAGQEPPQATFDDQAGVVTSTYRGVAGSGTVAHLYDGTERLLTVDGLEAHLESFMLNGEPAIAVKAMRIASPSDLLKLTRFAGEEGKGVVAVEKETLSRRSLERSGIPYKDAGSHWVMPASQGQPSSPMYSLRNRAKGTPAQEAILKRAMIHAAEANLTPWDRMQANARAIRDDIASGNTALNLKQAYVDALAPIDRYERAANGGLLLDAAQSAYKSAWMAKNNEQITAGVMKLGVPEFKAGTFEPVAGRKGLLDIFSPLFKTLNGEAQDVLWEGYAMAKRSNELIQQTNPDGTSREKLLSQPEIDELLDLENKYPHFKQVFDEYQEFNKQLLDLAVERGTLSKDSADVWSKNMYVPFYRHMDDKAESNEWRTGKGIAGKRVSSMRLTGSDQMVEPIIENIIKNTGAILDKVYANEAMRRVVALTDGIGMEKVKIPWQGTEMSAGEVEKAMARIGLHVGSKVNGKYLNHVAAQDMDKLVTFFKMTKPQGPDIVSVFEGGKPYYYKVTDTNLYRAVTAFNDIGSFDKVLGAILGLPKKVITLGVTLDPRFMYRNLIRDGLSAWAQTGTNPNMVKGISENIKEVAKDGAFLNRLRIAGYNGNEYFKLNEMRDFMDQMHGKKWTLLGTPKQLWRGYHKIGAVSEQMNRMTIAKHTLAHGGSMAEAAWQAQNTLNFSMRGDSKAMQLLIRAVPFLNARVQGLSRLYDGATGRDVTQNRQRAVTSFVMKMAGIMAAGGALTAYNWDDKRYQKIPDAAKDTYYHLFLGGHHFVLPKPFEIGAIMTTLPERTARWIGGKDNTRTYVESLQRMFGSIFSFDPTPQIAKPWIEDWANKDSFSGSPIVNQQLSGLEAPAQYDPKTSPTIKAVAQAMPWWAPDALRSPVRLEHLIQGYTAQIGQYAVQSADAIARGTGAAPAAPESRYGNKWLGAIEGTFGQGEDATDPRNKYMQQLYDAQDNVDKAYKTFDAYIKQGRIEEARELMLTSKTPLAYRNAIKTTAKEMGELRKIESSIYANETMSSAEKRVQLNKINAVRQRLLESAAPMIETAADYYH